MQSAVSWLQGDSMNIELLGKKSDEGEVNTNN